MLKKCFFIFIRKLPVLLAGILFLAMLFNCGQYINIKINGNTSTLSSMPEYDKRVVLRSSTSETASESNDLISPVFMGFKVGKQHSSSLFSQSARQKLKTISNPYIIKLFSGTAKQMDFANQAQKDVYFEDLENLECYIVLSFYNDIPAAAVLPAIAKDYERKNTNFVFEFSRLFIYPDKNGNIEAAAISSGNEVNILTPLEPVPFNSSELEAYNDSEEFTSFTFKPNAVGIPLYDKSIDVNLYSVSSTINLEYYKELDNKSNSFLDIFSINDSLVRRFTTRDDTILNFVDSSNELNINNQGQITYKSYENGVNLSEYLGYYPEANNEYTFSDKIASVKKLVDLLYNDVIGTDTTLSITKLDYNLSDKTLEVGLKYFCNGIVMTQNESDVVLKITGNYLTSASILALDCKSEAQNITLMPQVIFDSVLPVNKTVVSCCAVLKNIQETGIYEPVWVHNFVQK